MSYTDIFEQNAALEELPTCCFTLTLWGCLLICLALVRILHQAQSHVIEANATSVMGSSLIRLLHERR